MPFKIFAHYYDLIYSFKNYQQEVFYLLPLIEKYKKSVKNNLLDIACGTGNHLKFFKDHFNCMGVDLSPELLAVAQEKLLGIPLQQADMITMRLKKTFDVITCLFSSIGYTKTYENLHKAWETFALHLNPGGVILVEPWITPQAFIPGMPTMRTYDSSELKIARLDVSQRSGDLSLYNYEYLIAHKNQHVVHFQSHHELGLFSIERTLDIIKNVGLIGEYLEPGPIGRGLYVACKN